MARASSNGSGFPLRASGPGRACVSADDFISMLRHIAEAHTGDFSTRGRNPRLFSRVFHKEPTAGRFVLWRARFACAVQDLREWASSVSMLLCLLALQFALRLTKLNQSAACCFCCGIGRARHEEEVTMLTSIQWSLVNMIVQLEGLRSEGAARRRFLVEFLERQRISVPLATRVKMYLGASHPQHIRDPNIHWFHKVSTQLLMDLHEEMRAPPLPPHPFFVNLHAQHPHLVQELCHEAVVPLLVLSEDIVFCAGDPCLRMYCVVNGNLQYTMSQRDADPRRPGDIVVRRMIYGGQWLSEAALWTSWVHRGELRAITDGMLFALDAAGFARVISSHKAAHVLAAGYARKFVESLNRGPQTDLTEPATPPTMPPGVDGAAAGAAGSEAASRQAAGGASERGSGGGGRGGGGS